MAERGVPWCACEFGVGGLAVIGCPGNSRCEFALAF
jgi:hypothetical protein